MDKNQVMAFRDASVGDNFSVNMKSLGMTTSTSNDWSVAKYSSNGGLSCWHYWRDYYYPEVIRESYPVYIQERAMDKGKQAFEIIKILKDKRLVKLEKVGDFIDLMDELIKIL